MVYVWMIYEMVVPGMIFMVIFVMDLGLGGIEPMVNGRYMKKMSTIGEQACENVAVGALKKTNRSCSG